MLTIFYRLAAFKDVMLTDEATIRTNFLHLLSHLLLHEGHRSTSGKGANLKLTHLLDNDNTQNGDTEKIDSAVSIQVEKTTSEVKLEFTGNGTDLGDILHEVYDNDKPAKDGCSTEERKFVVLALRNLLCISYKAKYTVIEGKFCNASSTANKSRRCSKRNVQQCCLHLKRVRHKRYIFFL